MTTYLSAVVADTHHGPPMFSESMGSRLRSFCCCFCLGDEMDDVWVASAAECISNFLDPRGWISQPKTYIHHNPGTTLRPKPLKIIMTWPRGLPYPKTSRCPSNSLVQFRSSSFRSFRTASHQTCRHMGGIDWSSFVL